MKTQLQKLFLFMLAIGVLLGCTRTDQSATGNALPPTSSELPPAPTSTVAPQPTQSRSECVDGARFVQDLTFPDGSRVQPGETVDKRWSVVNSGTCDWGLGYRLIPQEPNPLVDDRESALYPAKAGTEAVWRVAFEAPEEPGEYIGSWQAINPDGQPFGDPVFVLISVDSEANSQ